MLEAHDENAENTSGKLTDGEIVAQSVVFLLAGSETIGATLAIAAYHLAHNPEIQDNLLSEIDDAVKSQGDTSTYEFVQSLVYLDKVISEVLPLSSIGFGNIRQCMDTCLYERNWCCYPVLHMAGSHACFSLESAHKKKVKYCN